MENRKCIYFVEGECEEKLINALKVDTSLVINGKVKKFNAITEELTNSKLITISPGSRVVLVFDTDVVLTAHLKKNIELLKTKCSRIEVLTIPQISNFEDEITNSTDVNKAQELTKSKTVDDFKKAVNKNEGCGIQKRTSTTQIRCKSTLDKETSETVFVCLTG